MPAASDFTLSLQRVFGETVRRLRREQFPPLSQEKLAVLSGLHRTEIGKLEMGMVEPRLSTIVMLAHGLNLPLDELMAELWDAMPMPEARKGPRAASD